MLTKCLPADRSERSAFSFRRSLASLAVALLLVCRATVPVAAENLSYSVSHTPITRDLAVAVTAGVVAVGMLAPSVYQSLISAKALEELCSGTVERRIYLTHELIPPGLATECGKHGIAEVVNARLGHITLVMVQKVGEERLNLTSKAIYLGLAEQVPAEGGFVTNESRTWKDVDPSLPDFPIHMVLVPKNFVMRDIFETEAMVGGCWNFPIVKDIYLEKDREKRCRSMREDAYEEAFSEQDRVDALLKAPAGSVTIVTMDTYQRNMNSLQLLRFNGVEPTPETLLTEDYTLAIPVYLYADGGNLGAGEGGNAMKAWVAEALSERALGEGGYLSSFSLSTIPKSEREWQRNSLLR